MGKPDGHVHTVPLTEREHEESKDCWCQPTLSYRDEINGCEVWVHKSPEEMCQ